MVVNIRFGMYSQKWIYTVLINLTKLPSTNGYTNSHSQQFSSFSIRTVMGASLLTLFQVAQPTLSLQTSQTPWM